MRIQFKFDRDAFKKSLESSIFKLHEVSMNQQPYNGNSGICKR